MNILPKLEGINFMVSHLNNRKLKNRVKNNKYVESDEKIYFSGLSDLSQDEIDLKKEKLLGKEIFNEHKKFTHKNNTKHYKQRFSTCIVNSKDFKYQNDSSFDFPFLKDCFKNNQQKKHYRTSSNYNQITSRTAFNQESNKQLQDIENIRKKMNYKSVCSKAKECLISFLNVCKKEEMISMQNSKEIRKSINSRNYYYNVCNPLTMQREKVNKRFSLLINEDSKISISHLSKDKQKLFTSGNDSKITNCNFNLNPSTVFKFKNIIKEKYGDEVMFSNKKNVKDDAPLNILDNPLPGERLKAIIKVKKMPKPISDKY